MKSLSEDEIRFRIESAITAQHADLAALMTGMQNELRQIAHRQRRRATPGETLSTTALVNEAYLKFASSPELFEQIDRKHFLALAARAMRHIVINHARDRVTQKRGAGAQHETLGAFDEIGGDLAEANRLLELNDALDRLEQIRPRLAQVVQLRYFAGLSEEETGEVLDLDRSTVRRDWRKARGWLYNKLHPDAAG
ncbi:MAG: sigma-70 family RNA polymerase sigma factor [Rudaea sp.]|uniref:ECF-type sigma factor n=1 Tax=unclassified Rudaea TaxID=2627037 RepID=UPI0010F7CC5C|nr:MULTISPECIES: ECF-type sigma factor [unclassified Rudaea]MBN8886334.1 sigma-70 family RNA polymerase sigma factor [Rudaea sp.]